MKLIDLIPGNGCSPTSGNEACPCFRELVTIEAAAMTAVTGESRLKKPITRRDLLNGAAVTWTAGAMLRPQRLPAGEGGAIAGNQIDKDDYPPVPQRTGTVLGGRWPA